MSNETELDEWLESLGQRVKTAAGQSVEIVAIEAAELVRDYTYPGRKKTRESVRHRMLGPRMAVVGLYFGRKFTKNRNTFTHRHFRETWHAIRPQLRLRLINRFNKQLQGR